MFLVEVPHNFCGWVISLVEILRQIVVNVSPQADCSGCAVDPDPSDLVHITLLLRVEQKCAIGTAGDVLSDVQQ